MENAWRTVITEEWSDTLRELSDLPRGQKPLRITMARGGIEPPTRGFSVLVIDFSPFLLFSNWALKQVSGQELASMGSRSCFTAMTHEIPAIPFFG